MEQKQVLKSIFIGLREGNLLGRLFLYSQNLQAPQAKREEKIANLNQKKEAYKISEIKTLKIKTQDNAVLDTLIISPRTKIKPEEKKYTIYFEGNATFYENRIYGMANETRNHQRTVIGFNYRGVGSSTGQTRSFNSMVEDGIAQVQRLLDEGATPENITVSGWSMGGAVATKVTEHFHQQGQKINLVNDRSFSNLINVLVGFIRTLGSGGTFGQNSGKTETPIGKFLGTLLTPLITVILLATGWEAEAAKAYQKLPDENKKAIHAIDDPMISNYASLHAGLDETARKTVTDVCVKKICVLSELDKKESNQLYEYLMWDLNPKTSEKKRLIYEKILKYQPDQYVSISFSFDEIPILQEILESSNKDKVKAISEKLVTSINSHEASLSELSMTENEKQANTIYQEFIQNDKTKGENSKAISKLNQLATEIKGLTVNFTHTTEHSRTIPPEKIQAMEKKLEQLQQTLMNQKIKLARQCSEGTQPTDFINKETEKLQSVVDATNEFIKNGLIPLAQADKIQKTTDSLVLKNQITALAEQINQATEKYKSETLKLSLPQEIIAGIFGFLGTVLGAAAGFMVGLAATPVGSAIGMVVGAAGGGILGIKAGEALSFRGYPIKRAAGEFAESVMAVPQTIEPVDSNKAIPRIYLIGPEKSGKTGLGNRLMGKSFTGKSNLTPPDTTLEIKELAPLNTHKQSNLFTPIQPTLPLLPQDRVLIIMPASAFEKETLEATKEELQSYYQWAEKQKPEANQIQLVITKMDDAKNNKASLIKQIGDIAKELNIVVTYTKAKFSEDKGVKTLQQNLLNLTTPTDLHPSYTRSLARF